MQLEMSTPPYKRSVDAFKEAAAAITLKADHRIILEERYVRLLYVMKRKCNRIAVAFHTNRLCITIGSILIPALLSVQHAQDETARGQALYWLVWGISLVVTISNGVLTMFKMDKKYYLFHAIYEQLRTEGWQFIALTGQYTLPADQRPAEGHEYFFQTFAKTVERIYIRQMEEEYIRLQETPAAPATKSARGAIPSLVDIQRTPNRDDTILQIAAAIKDQILSPPKSDASQEKE
jgi:hypothetical protein